MAGIPDDITPNPPKKQQKSFQTTTLINRTNLLPGLVINHQILRKLWTKLRNFCYDEFENNTCNKFFIVTHLANTSHIL